MVRFRRPSRPQRRQSYYSLIVADFNGDGLMDVAGGEYDGAIDIYSGKGNGTLQAPVSFPAGGDPAYLVGGDFNADGAPDIAAGNQQGGGLSILLNTAGTFITTTSSPNPSGVGQSATFTAKVKGSINTTITPTGSVTFYDGTTSLGKVTMAAGSAACRHPPSPSAAIPSPPGIPATPTSSRTPALPSRKVCRAARSSRLAPPA